MATNPYAVDFSQIPYSGMASGGNMFQGLGGSPQQAMAALGPAYNASYQGQLGMNIGLGNTVNNLYNQTMQNQLGGQQQAMAMLDNYGQSSRQQIADTTAQRQGTSQASMIDRGLGNFTVSDAATRGINYDATKENLQLNDQIAQQKVGLQNQFNQQNTGQADQQAQWLNSISAPYPNAGMYGQLATQYGAAGQSALNRQQASDQFSQMLAASKQGVPAAGGGGGVNPGYIQRSPSGLSGVGPGGVPDMGYVGIGGGAYTPPPQFSQQSTYGQNQFNQDLYAATDPNAYGGQQSGDGNAFMAATGFPSGLGGDPYAGEDSPYGGYYADSSYIDSQPYQDQYAYTDY